jgi:hypothetical protein
MICDCGKVLITFVPSGGAYIHQHYVTLDGKIICEQCAIDKGLRDRPTRTGMNTTYTYVVSDW